MRRKCTAAVAALAAGVMGAGLVAWCNRPPRSKAAEGGQPDPGGWAEVYGEWDAILARRGELEQDESDLRLRVGVREALIEDLVGGRAALAEVVDRLHALYHRQPKTMCAVRASMPGDGDREKIARVVFKHLAHPPADRPENQEALRRARTEFRALFPDADWTGL